MAYILGGEFRATGVTSFRNNLRKSLDDVYKNKLALIVTRPDDENVVVISEERFNELQREINNLKYLLKLAMSGQQIDSGETTLIDLDNI